MEQFKKRPEGTQWKVVHYRDSYRDDQTVPEIGCLVGARAESGGFVMVDVMGVDEDGVNGQVSLVDHTENPNYSARAHGRMKQEHPRFLHLGEMVHMPFECIHWVVWRA